MIALTSRVYSKLRTYTTRAFVRARRNSQVAVFQAFRKRFVMDDNLNLKSSEVIVIQF